MVDDGAEAAITAQVDEFLALWFAVRQQVQALNFNRAHLHGLSTTQFIVLGLLGDADGTEPPTIGALAGRLNLDPATLVRTVDSLEKRGLVGRRRATEDRRQVFVELTEAGRTTQQASHRRFVASVAAIFRGMQPENRAALVAGLQDFVTVGQEVIRQDGAADGTPQEGQTHV